VDVLSDAGSELPLLEDASDASSMVGDLSDADALSDAGEPDSALDEDELAARKRRAERAERQCASGERWLCASKGKRLESNSGLPSWNHARAPYTSLDLHIYIPARAAAAQGNARRQNAQGIAFCAHEERAIPPDDLWEVSAGDESV